MPPARKVSVCVHTVGREGLTMSSTPIPMRMKGRILASVVKGTPTIVIASTTVAAAVTEDAYP